MVTTLALLAIKGLLAARGVNVINTPIAERSAFREIFDCGGSLYTMDAAKTSNLDKAHKNIRSFAEEVVRLTQVPEVQTRKPGGMIRFLRRAA